MYPTPPSHENNSNVHSPMTNVEAPPESSVTEAIGINIKQESLVGTLAEELSKVPYLVRY